MKFREKYKEAIETYDRMVQESDIFSDIMVLNVIRMLCEEEISDRKIRGELLTILDIYRDYLLDKEV